MAGTSRDAGTDVSLPGSRGFEPADRTRWAPLEFSYVLPVRMTVDSGVRTQLTGYLSCLSRWCDDVIVVDGSPPAVYSANHAAWGGLVRHLAPDPRFPARMGKVAGVLTGASRAAHERIVIADDDVRYEWPALARVLAMLDDHDLVRPQNYFDPLPWHAIWDTARTLLNRALGGDFPGTLGVRRSTLEAAGGYDGDVLFENLELIRTVLANGGRVSSPLDLYVRRLPPSARHFFGQRTRQAYDDFAIPARMVVWLMVLPLVCACALRGRRTPPALLALASISIAEWGRRRDGGGSVFPAAAALLAPGWLLERGLCAWLAVAQRVRYGGVRYGDEVLRVAAHSVGELRGRALRGTVGPAHR